MSEPTTGYACRSCGEWHDDLPLSYRTAAPAYWSDELVDEAASELNDDLCIVRAEHFFVQGNLKIPVTDTGETFAWGVWVSLSAENFGRMVEVWEQPGREAEPPYFGWLSTELPYPASTLQLKTNVHTNPVGEKPWIEIEPTDHPLAVEVREGMTSARVQEIADLMLHG
jgi:hypothetical protein